MCGSRCCKQSSAALQSNPELNASNHDSVRSVHTSAIYIRLGGIANFCSTWHEGWGWNPPEALSATCLAVDAGCRLKL